MNHFRDKEAQAQAFYQAQAYQQAGKLFHEIWDERGDAFSGSRYINCLRKAGHPKAALTIARQVQQRHPNDIYVRREYVWALYQAQFKPAQNQDDLYTMVRVGQEILNLTDELFTLRLIVFPIVKLAKQKGRWQLVCQWCDYLDRHQLDTNPRRIGGRRVISEREQWYFAKIKSLIQLEQWAEARELALEAQKSFSHKSDFVRWGAWALAKLEQVPEAIAELETLLKRGRPSWYLLYDLAKLKHINHQLEEAYVTACQSALAHGKEQAKVGLFACLAEIAFEQGQFEVAARHAAFVRLLREHEQWSVPDEVRQLEAQARQSHIDAGHAPLEVWNQLSLLHKLCRQDWKEAVPAQERPQPKKKRSRATPRPSGDSKTGRVKKYIEERGFGFIVPDGGGKDIFFHITRTEGLDSPTRGMRVKFQVREGKKGLEAVNVQKDG